MNENTCSNQSSILDQLRTIPEGKQVRFILRRPDGSEFTHVSAIGRQYAGYPNGFDTVDKEIALATPFDASKGDAYVNEFWVRWTNPGSGRCGIVAIEQLAPPLPDLETLRKWVADGTQVRIEYTHDVPTAERIGPSPVMCKLLRTGDNSYPGGCGLFVSVAADTGGGDWNLFFSPIIEGYARPHVDPVRLSLDGAFVRGTLPLCPVIHAPSVAGTAGVNCGPADLGYVLSAATWPASALTHESQNAPVRHVSGDHPAANERRACDRAARAARRPELASPPANRPVPRKRPGLSGCVTTNHNC
jgi:hypothetical protein